MRLTVIGSGYVGTTIAACFAYMGHEVVDVDLDEDFVNAINRREAPIHEVGLPSFVDTQASDDGKGRLSATTDYNGVLDTDVTLLRLPTPQNIDGGIDLSILEAGATELGETLAEKNDWHTAVVKEQ